MLQPAPASTSARGSASRSLLGREPYLGSTRPADPARSPRALAAGCRSRHPPGRCSRGRSACAGPPTPAGSPSKANVQPACASLGGRSVPGTGETLEKEASEAARSGVKGLTVLLLFAIQYQSTDFSSAGPGSGSHAGVQGASIWKGKRQTKRPKPGSHTEFLLSFFDTLNQNILLGVILLGYASA